MTCSQRRGGRGGNGEKVPALHGCPHDLAVAITAAMSSRCLLKVSSTTISVGMRPSRCVKDSVAASHAPNPDSCTPDDPRPGAGCARCERSEEHTSELQ